MGILYLKMGLHVRFACSVFQATNEATMSAEELSGRLQFLLALCAIFVGFGALGGWNGSFSLQIFFLRPPCAQVNNSTLCCPSCLGVSNLEYSAYIAVPSLVAIGSVVCGGLLLDVLGLPTAAILSAFVNCFGNALRAVGSYFIFRHQVLVTSLILGQILIESSAYVLMLAREYISIRYFE